MLKAELGDILYYIIFAVVILAGLLEKVAKNKRKQQQAGTPHPPQPNDDFEDVDEQQTSGQAPPQSLEEMMRRMFETVETPEQKKVEAHPLGMNTEEAQSSEYIPAMRKSYYHPVEVRMLEESDKKTFSPVLIEEEEGSSVFQEYEFDIRKAVIASEILNRKY